jgi:tRNA(adenine34) deaminase
MTSIEEDSHKVPVHSKWMSEALVYARKAAESGEVPVGCVVVKDDTLIAAAHNLVESYNDVRAHAEMLALEKASAVLGNKYLHGCTLYVTLEPCPMCAGAIVWSKLDRIVFGAMDARAGACGSVFNIASSPHLNHRVDIIQGVLEQECESLMVEFFKSKRR